MSARPLTGLQPSADLDIMHPRIRAVVAIPIRNEADRLAACLAALQAQTGLTAGTFGVVLFLNNCTDDTAAIAAASLTHASFPCQIIERNWDRAQAGWARREAMEAAASWLRAVGRPDGVILTTDADSRVPADWVALNLGIIANGADAVAGRIALDTADAAKLPDALHARGRLEGAYESLLTELVAVLDPIPHDPWPRHRTRSGASIACTLAAYESVGGMPALSLGEDRAFLALLVGDDVRVRHDPDVVVVTSGRLDGRAAGGAADTMRLRCEAPDSRCDRNLEPVLRALIRAMWRRRLQQRHRTGTLDRVDRWAPFLGIGRERARAIAKARAFGAAWSAIEDASPVLASRPLWPRDLPFQIALARRLLLLLRTGGHVVARLRRVTEAWIRPRIAPAARPSPAEQGPAKRCVPTG